jgi:hypothetical protein
MTRIRAVLIALAVIFDGFRFQDYATLGKNGAVRKMVER